MSDKPEDTSMALNRFGMGEEPDNVQVPDDLDLWIDEEIYEGYSTEDGVYLGSGVSHK